MQERNVWVDYAKAIGIILVVYGHVARGVFNAGLPMDEGEFVLVDSIIYSFHMPLFFFLSGLFFFDSLQKRGRGGLIINKVDTIVYPFIVWSLLQGLFEVVLSNYTNGQVTLTEVFSLLWMPRAQFWFLYALFLVFLVCTFLYAKADRRYFLPFVVLFGVLFVFQQELTINNMTRNDIHLFYGRAFDVAWTIPCRLVSVYRRVLDDDLPHAYPCRERRAGDSQQVPRHRLDCCTSRGRHTDWARCSAAGSDRDQSFQPALPAYSAQANLRFASAYAQGRGVMRIR